MQAGYYKLPVYRGSPINALFTFVTKPDRDPVDLTGLSPFTFQMRSRSRGPLLLEGTVVDTDLDAGKITLTATAAATASLPLNGVSYDVLDVTGAKWLYGPVDVEANISEI